MSDDLIAERIAALSDADVLKLTGKLADIWRIYKAPQRPAKMRAALLQALGTSSPPETGRKAP